MTILFLIQCSNLGGMEQSTVLLIDELKKMGHNVELISLNEMGPLEPVLREHGIPASAVGYRGRWGWRSFLPLRRLLRAQRADALVMVGHNLMALLALGNVCKSHRALSLHYHHKGVKSMWGWRLIYRVATWRFKQIIYPSQFIIDEALSIVPRMRGIKRTISYPIPSPFVVPDMLDSKTTTVWREKLGLGDCHQIVGNAGWLIPRKRWDVFLHVAAIVAAALPEARFVIAGDGPELPRLKQLTSDLKISDRVIWLGWQRDLSSFYRVLDVMLFNSDWDAMGRTPLEAMSYGVPVVASVVHGGLREMFGPNEYGLLSNKHDSQMLACKIIELLQNKVYAKVVGGKSRAHIIKIGDPRLHAERVLQCLSGGREPSVPVKI